MTNQQSAPATVSIETLEELMAAFNAHDLDAIMEFFVDDCVFDTSAGPDPWGRRLVGKDAVRAGLAARFAGVPDVHYDVDRHWISGDLGVSEWTVTGTATAGELLHVRGCDHWEFRDGKIARKDSYWKIVESPA
ncbi:MAG TPA: nuclear transport factor 2 family protein [Gordonia polyisoprenivorans]|nr:nuclear transport factor 2 family protein [Gordonia polyisoprenivorans]